jgi:hypothetical protein
LATQTINLDLDQMWEPVSVGIRRAYVFAGLGTNAALHPDLNDFHLPGLIKFSFVPYTATPDVNTGVKVRQYAGAKMHQ